MQYDADFASPDGVPMDHVIFGAEPTFWVVVLLLAALAAVGGWAWGRRETLSRPEAVESIWSAIDKALRDAMQAHDGVLLGKAQEVLRVIDSRLGRTLKVAEGLAGPLKALREAVAGATRSEPAAQGHDHGHDHGHASAKAAPETASEAAAPSAAAGAVTIVNVGTAPTGGGDSHTTHTPPSPREQLDRMRLAIAALNQHWRAEDDRTAELRAAHAELSGH